MEKSKGHVGFANGFEFFYGPDGDLYRAVLACSYIATDGYRSTGRFESTPATADYILKVNGLI